MKNLKEYSLTNLRMIGVEQVTNAKSGHPGMVMSAAPLVHELYLNHFNAVPSNPKWINRDRLILSAGHGSALLYSLLHIAGFNIKKSDLMKFRTLDSLTPGHPESHLTDGVDASTGPLGQGFAMAVGSAMAEKHLAAKYNKPGLPLFDHHTYVICGDGDLQEGIVSETMQIAGLQKLEKLIVLYDSNDVQLDTKVNKVQKIDLKKWCEAQNWNYIFVKDGFNLESVDKAIADAKKSNKPTLVECKTIIGFGHEKQGTPAMHGAPFSEEAVQSLREKFNYKEEPFTVNVDVKKMWEENFNKRGETAFEKWSKIELEYKEKFSKEYKEIFEHKTVKVDEFKELKHSNKEATRTSSGKVLKKLQELTGNMLGGCADLSSATKAQGFMGEFNSETPTGNNILFGVREFGMAAITNGIQEHGGLKAFDSTFLVFSDYMRNAIRLGAIAKLPAMHILTHDSIAVGFDGPTHEPVEHLASLRAMPNLFNFRPADMNETIGSYVAAYNLTENPSTLIFCRQDLKQLEGSSAESVAKGGYIVYETKGKKPDLIFISTGSEVELTIETAKLMETEKKSVRVVSMPCVELFESQDVKYQESILPVKHDKYIVVEAGSSFGWHKFTGRNGLMITVNTFGKSADGAIVLADYGFEPSKIVSRIKNWK
ncbi:transketolase [Spiroplasma sp. TIUS-1]|uniref:transketolase n=1 Tax=Spiroplasma sp. TIUS-1 TaxID=216963 RepID=UPI0013982A8E|nr:transketolase [Spiroplasma sp. TIUS-1]QHX35703.1 transketolase [Spiroplasma sp. TIUS-1]